MPPGVPPGPLPSLGDLVVPLDGSADAERALIPALVVADALDARVHLVAEGWSSEGDAIERRLRELAAGSPRVASTSLVEGGGPIHAIDTVVDRTGGALVCMATHGRDGFAAAVLGSVAEGVLRARRAPVLLVGPSCVSWDAPPVGPVVAALDGSREAEAVIPTAVTLAAALGGEVQLVTVVAPDPEGSHRSTDRRGPAPVGGAEAYLTGTATRAAASAATVGVAAGAAPIEAVLIEHASGPAAGIADHLVATPGALLALTTRARTGLARALVGSSAAEILRRAAVPVIVVPRT